MWTSTNRKEVDLSVFVRKDVDKDQRYLRGLLTSETRTAGTKEKIELLGAFVKAEGSIAAFMLPTTAPAALGTFDATAALLGYAPATGAIYAFPEDSFERTDFSSIKVKEAYNDIPTLDFYSYSNKERLLCYVLLYDDVGGHYFHYPVKSLVLASSQNEEFVGKPLALDALNPLIVKMLRKELGGVEVKEVDKMDIVRKIVEQVSSAIQKFNGGWDKFNNKE